MQLKRKSQQKPKLRLKTKAAPDKGTPFERLVWEAVDVHRRLDSMETPYTSPKRPLSAAAYLQESLDIANSTRDRIHDLRNKIQSGTFADATLRRMTTEIAGPNRKNPPLVAGKLESLSNAATTAQLAQLGSFTTAELFALAALIAGERYPEIFGPFSSTAELKAQRDHLERRRAELFDAINNGYKREDIVTDKRDAMPTFKLAPDVPIAPSANAAERLVKALLANPTD